jgi:hypothetical protein
MELYFGGIYLMVKKYLNSENNNQNNYELK